MRPVDSGTDVRDHGSDSVKADHRLDPAPPVEHDNIHNQSTRRLNVHKRFEKSHRMRALAPLIKPFKPRLVTPKVHQPAGSQKLDIPGFVKKKCTYEERQVEGIWLYDFASVVAKPQAKKRDGEAAGQTKSERKRKVFYFAGGGWQSPPTNDHWGLVAELSHRLPGTEVTVVSYPLAPKMPASKSMPQLRKWYETIMSDPDVANDHIVFAGDSAGGNIVLSLVLWNLTDPTEGVRAPDAMMVTCPSTDLRHVDPKIKEIVEHDPLFTEDFIQSTSNAWAYGDPDAEGTDPEDPSEWSKTDPRVSPIFADLSQFVRHGVKVHGIHGTHDILCAEAITFRERLADLGVGANGSSGRAKCTASH